MKTKTSIILASMMFLQYYVWGSWYVTMGTFMTKILGSTGIQIGAALSALAIATMISPFFVGMIAIVILLPESDGIFAPKRSHTFFIASKITPIPFLL
jgi:hypothetical protein